MPPSEVCSSLAVAVQQLSAHSTACHGDVKRFLAGPGPGPGWCLVCSAVQVLCSVLPGVLSSCCAVPGWCWLLCRCAQCLVCSGVQVCALFLLRTVPVSFAVLLLPAWCLPGVLVLPVSFASPGTWCASVLVPGASPGAH